MCVWCKQPPLQLLLSRLLWRYAPQGRGPSSPPGTATQCAEALTLCCSTRPLARSTAYRCCASQEVRELPSVQLLLPQVTQGKQLLAPVCVRGACISVRARLCLHA